MRKDKKTKYYRITGWDKIRQDKKIIYNTTRYDNIRYDTMRWKDKVP